MKADNLRISKVFSSGGDIHYVLPHFQREYTWEKVNWKTLFEDALAVYDETESAEGGVAFGEVEHFLGSIVVIHDGMRAGTISAFKLVDGQQRLTTIALLLKALSKACVATHPPLTKKLEKLLVNADEDGELFFKILPTIKNGDRAAYCALLKNDEVPANRSRVPEAYLFFEESIKTRLESGLDPERFATVVTNLFQVVFVELDERESPYRIFESLNAKGKPLTQADLVRNYVAMKLPASDQERVFQTHWRRVEELLQESRYVGRLPELTAFLRHYLAMQTGVLCDEQHVYGRFRDRSEREFGTATLFEAELAMISRFATHYDKLLRPDGIADRETAEALTRLNVLEISTGYPFLLRISDEHSNGAISDSELRGILAVLEAYLVRRHVAGEQGNLNKMFPTLFAAIDPHDKIDSLKRALAERKCPTNAAVLRGIASRRAYEKSAGVKRKTGLVLETINRHFSAGTGGFTVLDGSATIEHVMPQTLSEDWKSHLGLMWEQTHRDFLHVLGNLTLVTGEWNSELSNGPFSEKKAKLSGHALRINSDYFSSAPNQWGRTEIQNRGDVLAAAIIELWPSFIRDDDGVDTLLSEGARTVSEFHFEAVERVAAHLGIAFQRISESRFASSDGKHRLVGLCSKSYRRGGEARGYWFGFKMAQNEFLNFQGVSWLALECETPEQLLLFPLKEFALLLPHLDRTEGQHWHIRLRQDGERILLPLPTLAEQRDVAPYRI